MGEISKALQLDVRIRNRLEEAGIYTFSEFLATSERDLLSRANLCMKQIEKVRSLALSSIRTPQRLTSLMELGIGASKYWKIKRSLGCPILDEFLKGGIPARGILELSGESGSGKTQICLQAALTSQIHHGQNTSCSTGTIYICTEDPFPSRRLQQMIQELKRKYPEAKDITFGDHIFVEHVCDLAGLKDCLLVRLPCLLRTSAIPFGLIVVDSIAGVFRGAVEDDGTEILGDGPPKGIADDIRTRAMDLKEIAASLHATARSHGLSVICVNQVSDAVDGVQGFGRNKKVPALGLAWSNMVTTRLMASRTNEFLNVSLCNAGAMVRELEVIFSPELPPGKCKFIVTNSGVAGIK